jgi:hypothetical protein
MIPGGGGLREGAEGCRRIGNTKQALVSPANA